MRHPFILSSSLLIALATASTAEAATWYASPTGTSTCGCTTRETPCSLSTASYGAVAGDTVILMDGVYQESLYVTNSGTADAWITFQADECATPIIEGAGVPPDDENQDNGVHSTTATYVRFVGLVSRGWNIGFGNGWTGSDNSNSNGHWEFTECLAYSNGRTGFTFFSAEGIKIKNCISAHNGSSRVQSWSSGITLLRAIGTENVVEGNVSFENMDAEGNSDGSGFIVDEQSNGALFINNLAFRNAGSCLRLTRSSGTRFINNTCYHNAQNPAATGPTNPSELYFTESISGTNTSFLNNVLVATGTGPGAQVVQNKPTSGWQNNVEARGAVTFLTAPTGTNPDFTPAASATDLIGKGMAGGDVPTTDLGLDPKCIVKREPVLVGQIAKGGWWEYDVDIDYIKSIGGVKKCFNAGARSGTPDIGAYKNGVPATMSPGACVPPVAGTPVSCPAEAGAGGVGSAGVPGSGGSGGSVAAGGTTSAGGTVSTGGTDTSAGGTAPAAGGSVATGGAASSTGGVAPGSGGTTGLPVAGSTAVAGTTSSAGSVGTGGPSGPGGETADAAEKPSGCGCRVPGVPTGSKSLAALGLVGLGLLAYRRRRSR